MLNLASTRNTKQIGEYQNLTFHLQTSSQASRSHHAFQPRQLTRNRGFSRNSRKRVFSGILRVEIINCNQRLASRLSHQYYSDFQLFHRSHWRSCELGKNLSVSDCKIVPLQAVAQPQLGKRGYYTSSEAITRQLIVFLSCLSRSPSTYKLGSLKNDISVKS